MMRISWPQPMAIPSCLHTGLAGGRGKYGSKIEIRYHEPGLWSLLSQARLIHVVSTGHRNYGKEVAFCDENGMSCFAADRTL